MAGLNPNRAPNFLAIQFQLDNVIDLNLQPLRHLGTDEHGVVPSELGHRLGQFLQPAVVGELPVVDGGIAADVELDLSLTYRIYRRTKWISSGVEVIRKRFWGERRPLNPSIMQRFAPELLEIGAGVLLLPIAARQIIASRVRLAGKERNEFQRALAVVQ